MKHTLGWSSKASNSSSTSSVPKGLRLKSMTRRDWFQGSSDQPRGMPCAMGVPAVVRNTPPGGGGQFLVQVLAGQTNFHLQMPSFGRPSAPSGPSAPGCDLALTQPLWGVKKCPIPCLPKAPTPQVGVPLKRSLTGSHAPPRGTAPAS